MSGLVGDWVGRLADRYLSDRRWAGVKHRAEEWLGSPMGGLMGDQIGRQITVGQVEIKYLNTPYYYGASYSPPKKNSSKGTVGMQSNEL